MARGGSDEALSSSRMLAVLSLFQADRLELGVSEVSRDLGLSKASVSRFFAALERGGYVEQDPTSRKFTLGAEVLRLGNLFAPFGRIQDLARPLMRELVAASGFTSYLSVRRRTSMVILAAEEGPGPIRYSIPVGYALPLHSSATGKAALACLSSDQARTLVRDLTFARKTEHTITDEAVFLAHLAEVRVRGYSINWEENTPGVGSVAAAVIPKDGLPVVVVSLGFATSQISRDGCEALGEKVRVAADALRDRLREP